jgi:hypothetical protein
MANSFSASGDQILPAFALLETRGSTSEGRSQNLNMEDGQMKAQNKFAKLAFLVITGSLLLSLSTLVAAESDAARAIRASAANVPTNIPGILTYAEPPKGFNPLTATDVELATYGFPPRPDKQADPDDYAVWERAMKRAKIRWTGDLKPLPNTGQGKIPAGSTLLPEVVQSQTGPQLHANVTGSGVMLTNKQTSWSSKKSFNFIDTIMTVPTGAWALNPTCNFESYGPVYSLAGIDGSISPGPADGYPLFTPGLVAGVYENAACGSSSTDYFAFVGYFPVINAAPFSVNPGDVVFASVSVQNSCSGQAYVEDFTTGVNSAYGIGVGACPFKGQNAEWTVSRGCCQGFGPDGEFELPNTTNIFAGFGGYAATGNTDIFYPASQASSTLVLTMMDDTDSEPIEEVNQISSFVEGEHLYGLLFTTTGCAEEGGCTP